MIVSGLASVIIGEAIFGTKSVVRTTLAVVCGAIIYRIVIALAMQIKIFDTGDLKLLTAIIVIIALVLPKVFEKRKDKKRKAKRKADRLAQLTGKKEGEPIA